jgi:hypothetical protein
MSRNGYSTPGSNTSAAKQCIPPSTAMPVTTATTRSFNISKRCGGTASRASKLGSCACATARSPSTGAWPISSPLCSSSPPGRPSKTELIRFAAAVSTGLQMSRGGDRTGWLGRRDSNLCIWEPDSPDSLLLKHRLTPRDVLQSHYFF